jgi:hypothetical protein
VIRANKFKNLFVGLLFLGLPSCQSTTPPKKAVSLPLQTVITQPPQLHTATLVNIKNDWNGYSDITPIVRHYKLKPTANGMTGNGHFAVGGYGAYNIHQQYTKKIHIPVAVTQQFFHKLGETKMQQSATYQPVRNHSDDYPNITIQVITPQQEMTFFSSSQGKNYTPWQIKTKQKIYTSNSAMPAEALLILKPYIDHPGLEQVINKRQAPKKILQPQPQAKNKFL